MSGWLGGGLASGLAAESQGGQFLPAFAAAGVGAIFGGGDGVEGFMAATVGGGLASEITGGKFKNGAASGAFMWALQQGSKSFEDRVIGKVGKCATTGKCYPSDFTESEKRKILDRIQSLTTEVKGREFETMEKSLEALHHSGLVGLTEEYGIEFWAQIDGATNEVYEISTGFHRKLAKGAEDIRTSGDIVWHTHP